MSQATVISLRGHLAHRRAAKLRRLPPELRTRERAAPALDAIVAYAWEPSRAGQPAEPARICQRLEEFGPAPPSGDGEWPLLHWLYDNLVPEAWESPHHLAPLLRDCLRES